MKLTHYPHGIAFQETFTVTLRGQVVGDPIGWGSAEHEAKWLENGLREVVKNAVARFYQCELLGTSIKIEFK